MKIWSLLFIPAIGIGSFSGSMGRKNITIQVNDEKIDINPTKFEHFIGDFKKMVGVNFDEFKDSPSKKINIVLPCWNGNLLEDYYEKAKTAGQGKFQQHLNNFRKAWELIEQKVRDILNKTYGCLDASELKMRIGVINLETMKETENSGMIRGEMKKIVSGGTEQIPHKTTFAFNWIRNIGKTAQSKTGEIIQLYDADIGGQVTVKELCKMVYSILNEAAKLTLKKYKWEKKISSNRSQDTFSAIPSNGMRTEEKIKQFNTGGTNQAFELSQWCFRNIDQCTQNNWDNDKLFEFFSSCYRNKTNGGESLLLEFVEQVKKIIKGDDKNSDSKECSLWNQGITCSEGGWIWKK
ncbi:hypothetical protein [Mycoplasma parvum]|uniref:Uncharacterized protein n=1 Tax=Mycoplasma parvum str. Indiana TaxID=1403316 RepID=U5NCH8_9MOLU|nr:hypothetical protein [Mycoplasma parvum]AGX89132.1 hypothetical protein PRV_01970 [Mycoplasma parvum str. Indiana]